MLWSTWETREARREPTRPTLLGTGAAAHRLDWDASLVLNGQGDDRQEGPNESLGFLGLFFVIAVDRDPHVHLGRTQLIQRDRDVWTLGDGILALGARRQ